MAFVTKGHDGVIRDSGGSQTNSFLQKSLGVRTKLRNPASRAPWALGMPGMDYGRTTEKHTVVHMICMINIFLIYFLLFGAVGRWYRGVNWMLRCCAGGRNILVGITVSRNMRRKVRCALRAAQHGFRGARHFSPQAENFLRVSFSPETRHFVEAFF